MKFFSSTRYTPQQLQNIAIDLFCDVLGSILSAIGIYTFAKLANFAPPFDFRIISFFVSKARFKK